MRRYQYSSSVAVTARLLGQDNIKKVELQSPDGINAIHEIMGKLEVIGKSCFLSGGLFSKGGQSRMSLSPLASSCLHVAFFSASLPAVHSAFRSAGFTSSLSIEPGMLG